MCNISGVGGGDDNVTIITHSLNSLSLTTGTDDILLITINNSILLLQHKKNIAHFCEHTINPFTAADAMWRPEVITHTAICLTSANKYFYASQHSIRLF